MRLLLAGCALLFLMNEARAQVPTRDQRIGNGRITQVFVQNVGPALKEVTRPPAPFGKLMVAEWQVDTPYRYRYSLKDTAGNTWWVAFQSSQEDFSRHPTVIQGWIMEIEDGNLRIGTLYGSYLVGSPEMKGKGIPASFVIQSAPDVKTE